jgi:hypothetical protein
MPREAKGVVIHDDGRPLLGRKLAGKSQRELRDLGLTRAGTPEGGDERERVGVGHAGRQAPHDALGSWAERFISSG